MACTNGQRNEYLGSCSLAKRKLRSKLKIVLKYIKNSLKYRFGLGQKMKKKQLKF